MSWSGWIWTPAMAFIVSVALKVCGFGSQSAVMANLVRESVAHARGDGGGVLPDSGSRLLLAGCSKNNPVAAPPSSWLEPTSLLGSSWLLLGCSPGCSSVVARL